MIHNGDITRDLGRGIVNYLILSDKYFEDLNRYRLKDKNIINVLKKFLKKNEEYEIRKNGIWFFCYPGELNTPHQGWKIHISATIENYKMILYKILPILFSEKVVFKVICDQFLLGYINSKNYERSQAGKFITIYTNSVKKFKHLLEKLYTTLKDFEGPHILSDKPYKDSKIIFYRYGGFTPKFMLNVYGERIPIIVTPDGKYETDIRKPYPSFPSWVLDPFPNIYNEHMDGDIILKKIYKIKSAISFSNGGGIYLAEGPGKVNYIIKEARPYVILPTSPDFSSTISAKEALLREYKILLKLKDSGYSPIPIDFFEEEDHAFLVMERLRGIPLSSFRSRDDFCIVLKKDISDEFRDKFLNKFSKIVFQLVDAIKKFHEKGVIIRDISPNNILINPESLGLKFIDFETSIDITSLNHLESVIYMATPGFNPPKKRYLNISKKDDYYSLGAVLYSTILPITSLFNLNPDAKENIINEIFTYYKLPCGVKRFILSLMKSKENRRLDLDKISSMTILSFFKTSPCRKTKGLDKEKIKLEIENTLEKISKKITSSFEYERRDRLLPSDYRVFLTNPLNIAYGALGPLYFIYRYKGQILQKPLEWILSHEITNDRYPPSFYVGLSGIAYVLAEMGFVQNAENIMNELFSSPLLYEAVDIFYGAAGWGISSLYFYLITKKKLYLDWAIEAVEFIIKQSKKYKNALYWENVNGEVYFGFLHGNSGIAFFFFLVYIITKDEKYLEYAMKAISFELYNVQLVENFLSLPKYLRKKEITMPYFQFGSSGLGMVLIRMYRKLGIQLYKFLSHHIFRDSSIKFGGYPTLFRGLSGLGQFMVDMFLFTSEQSYIESAYQIADSILFYKVRDKEGICFPGEELLRLSCDYGLGSSGIGMFFKRLLHPSPREFMLDELIFPELSNKISPISVGRRGDEENNKTNQY